MSWSGGGLYPPWGGVGLSAHNNYRQPSSNQEQLKREAARRRKAEAANSLAEQRRKAGAINDGEDLFSGPTKTDGHTDVERVLGPIEDAHRIINKTSCFGVDYQPPTPAPAQQHVIGEEDDEEVKPPVKKPLGPPLPRAPAMARPPPFPKQPPRPPVNKSWAPGPMAPPRALAPAKHHKLPGANQSQSQSQSHSQSQSSKPATSSNKPKLSPLKMPSNDKKPSVAPENSIEDEDADIKAIFQEMKHPYQSDTGGLPTPLTGIETPRVDTEDRGAQRHKPVYLGVPRNPFQYKDEAKQLPSSPKREPQPQEDIEKPLLSKASVSKDTSSSSSSSDSDSNEELDDAKPSEFDLRTLFNGAKPTPSPRQPTSSPPTSYLASPVKTEGKQSPLAGLGLPKLMDPIISPVRDQPSPHHIDKSDQEKEFRQKKNRKDSGKVKPSKTHKTSKASSDDEDLNDKKRHRSPKKKPVKAPPSSEKSGKKKAWSFMDDSDSEPERRGRSFSSSPAKKAAKKPLSSSQTRSPSGQKVSRSGKSSSNISHSSHLSSKSQPQHRKSEPSRVKALSDSEEEEPPAPSATKSKIFSKMFGGLSKASGGGKGKGKGGGGKGGGITITSKEESEDIDDDRGNMSRSSPSPTQVKKEAVASLAAEREKTASWSKVSRSAGLKEDLSLSEDSMSSPGLSRQSSLVLRTDGKPSLLTSISLSRLGRSLDKIQSKMKQKKKAGVKQECWITGGGKDGLEVRKSQERTLSESEGESRKRRERDESPLYDLETSFSKRLRQDQLEQNSLYGSGTETPPTSQELPWPGAGGNLMMPPPFPPKRVYYSYFERRQQDEAFDDDEENVVELAKRLKHEADQETNMNTKCRKYLQAIMMFSVCGSRTETMGDKMNAYNMYIQTLSLIKFLMKLNNTSRNNNQDVDIRLVVLSLRAQSLLNLKLYKMKRHELKDYQKTIQDVLARSEDDQPASEQQGQISPTPSPAGSEGSNCSKSSDYYSSGENRMPGVLTPPTAPPICLSIPRNVMQNQYNFCSYLSQCHELWEQADLYVVKRGICEDFFIRLDQECGPLTLHSSLKDLVNYTRKGLDSIEHERLSGPSSVY